MGPEFVITTAVRRTPSTSLFSTNLSFYINLNILSIPIQNSSPQRLVYNILQNTYPWQTGYPVHPYLEDHDGVPTDNVGEVELSHVETAHYWQMAQISQPEQR